jgi:hypothetical protein
MTVVQINVCNSKPLQRFLDCFFAVLAAGVYFVSTIWSALVGELGCKKDILSLFGIGGKPFANEILRIAVDVGFKLSDHGSMQ